MTQLHSIALEGKLSLGIVFPIESYTGSIPKMENQEQLAKRVEELGFKALWFRDIPFNDPSFGDTGQLYDPWIYMTHIMNHTSTITLATGSVILPLRHPVHIAKSLLSLQTLSEGRIILGVASGDRSIEYPAFNKNISQKSELFRDSFNYIKALHEDFPIYQSEHFGKTTGSIDLLPKYATRTPFLVTGYSGQSLNWIAKHSDGWLYYPRDFSFLRQKMAEWRKALEDVQEPWKPYMQSLYLDLEESKSSSPKGIHLGFKSGSDYALEHLKALESNGVNHIVLNLKYGSRPIEVVIEELGENILPHFS